MFNDAYKFIGSHAKKVDELTAIFEENSKVKMFNRVVDVYINAPIIGFLYKRKADKDSSEGASKVDKTIFLQQVLDASVDLKYIFRLISFNHFSCGIIIFTRKSKKPHGKIKMHLDRV